MSELFDFVVTDKALLSYREMRGRTQLFDSALALSDAMEEPLFSIPGDGEATLYGLIDSDGRRFLALTLNDAVIQIGPPHYWLAAKEAWRKVGWNVNKQKPCTPRP